MPMIDVDSAVKSINYNGSGINTVYIGSDKVYPMGLPPIIPTTTLANSVKLKDAIAASTDPVFKRSLSPLSGPGVIDVSDAGDGSVTFKDNKWYSQHESVGFESGGTLILNNNPHLTHINIAGFNFDIKYYIEYPFGTMEITANRSFVSMFMNIPNVVEIDVSELDTTHTMAMQQMFDVTPGKNLQHHVDVKYGPKFLPTALMDISRNNGQDISTWKMFGDIVEDNSPDAQWRIVRPWNPAHWERGKENVQYLSWVYTSNTA